MPIDHYLVGLKPIRRYRGLSLAEAGDLIGVTSTSYARFEAGTRRIYFDKACVLADALGCSIADLRHFHSDDELFHLLPPWKRPVEGAVEPQDTPQPGPPPPPSSLVPPPPPADYNAAAALEGWGTVE
jgi:transcriptional regulator with XRE-family HTH domain